MVFIANSMPPVAVIQQPYMQRQIPLNVPQTFPPNWEEYFADADTSTIPTEEQLYHPWYQTDEDFNKYYEPIGVNVKALVFAVMHVLDVPTSAIPEVTTTAGGAFNAVFCITLPLPTPKDASFASPPGFQG
ncbi:unnamed protein product [Cyclocybe aegerita]|uniref:Uncharacterized protein n=1 Tax=Cyclocybe aegerita TaxID=1973307 RepID=A0A8S0X162_CYCAE|nr:unnamed protein product [Cyclocybe aegerita]